MRFTTDVSNTAQKKKPLRLWTPDHWRHAFAMCSGTHGALCGSPGGAESLHMTGLLER